jgi:hypothetical protein
MKKLFLLISLTLVTATSFGQWGWNLDFDSPAFLDRVYNDTVSNPNCIWQVGHPTKTVFNSAYSNPNAIVTDTLNPVPAHDTSTFYLMHQRDNFAPWHGFYLDFWFQMDGDSTDYGRIEISPDSGLTWINILNQDTTYQIQWQSIKPTLKGSTSGWQEFRIDMTQWASGWGTFPVAMTADTILFRFTYITDSSSTPHDGWIIDNFILEDVWEGIQEYQNNNIISIAPNPTNENLLIHKTKSTDNASIQIYDCKGQLVSENKNFKEENISTKNLQNGVYLLKYSDTKNYSVKRFVVQH